MSTTSAAAKTADTFIARAEQAGLWPVKVLDAKPQITLEHDGEQHTVAAGRYSGLAGVYASGEIKCLGINGSRYSATTPEEWRKLVRAAVEAGAEPLNSGRGATAWGSKVSAEFRIGTTSGQGLEANLCLTDSFDGSCRLSVTPRVIRGRCTNTLRGYAREMGDKVHADFVRGLRARHTASLRELVKYLALGIPRVLAEAELLDQLLGRASSVHLPAKAAQIAFDRLFPTAEQAAKAAGKDPDKVTQKAQTQAENRRAAARIACALDINKMGGPGNLGSLWMGATHAVDRVVDPETHEVSERKLRNNADPTEAMLFGERGRRVEEIREFIQVVLADGSIEEMSVSGALEAGAVDGAAILQSMLN